MDFEWSSEEQATRAQYADFARKELASVASEDERGGRFPTEAWKKCGDFGLFGIGVPREFDGGDGAGIITAMLAMEGLGYGCRDNGLAFAINGQFCIKMPIVQLGTQKQKEEYLPRICRGEMLSAFAFTEPEFGSDLYSLQTQAKKQGDRYLLSGTKKFVTFAPIADLILVLATVNPGLGKWGLTAFLVDARSAGVSVSPPRDKMGLRTVPLGEVTLDNCSVAADALLGSEGSGMAVLNCCLEWERCCALASQVGAMQRQLEDCVEYARQRKQFGQPIGKFQSVANRIVDMKVRLETARLLLYKTGWLKQQGKQDMMHAAMSKLYLSECFVQSSMDAIRIHGGAGYMSDTGVERDLRDSIGGTLYGGTSDIQRNTIAGLMGL